MDDVAFLSGVDLVISPPIWFFASFSDIKFGAMVYLSLGKFFAYFIVWSIAFYLAKKIKPVGPSYYVAGALFLLIFALLLLTLLIDEELKGGGKVVYTDAWIFLLKILLPTMITYLLFMWRIRWRAMP